ncbi:uncharacterized protein B4U79_09729 [Dinothrombium tinctorium]|uniref:Uncharacterized protein n=1 Tax=Dinothrombium tinctorium TaxID=1965070 RepID=A0A3S3PG95_9ACAR|nr:uncharacterized protein B4U79_01223 [Dinothrombium tinctorium]RWS14625.1 uncharacterized protein B4U79_09729 [Dinothrombium tinctorium]
MERSLSNGSHSNSESEDSFANIFQRCNKPQCGRNPSRLVSPPPFDNSLSDRLCDVNDNKPVDVIDTSIDAALIDTINEQRRGDCWRNNEYNNLNDTRTIPLTKFKTLRCNPFQVSEEAMKNSEQHQKQTDDNKESNDSCETKQELGNNLKCKKNKKSSDCLSLSAVSIKSTSKSDESLVDVKYSHFAADQTSNESDLSDNDYAKKEIDELMESDISTDPPSPAKEPEIARIIGNVPIAKYEGSPRRYGPKPPGFPQRVVNNEEISVGLCNFSKNNSRTLTDISCDELVKSILKIPPSNHESPTTTENSSKSPSRSASLITTQEEFCDKSKSKTPTVEGTVSSDFNGLKYKLTQMNSGSSYIGKRLATHSCAVKASSEDEKSNDCISPVEAKKDPILSHANELVLLHELVHQHRLHEMSASDVGPMNTCSTIEPEVEVVEQTNESMNFNLSSENTDCDSNELESEFSFESSLHSGSKLSHMPILEDGLSSGVPSSDNEAEDDNANDSPLTLDFMRKQISEMENEIKAEEVKLELLFLRAKEKQQDTDCKDKGKENVLHNGLKETKIENIGKEAKHYMRYQHGQGIKEKDVNCCENKPEGDADQETIWFPRVKKANKSKGTNDDDTAKTKESKACHLHEEECDTDQETDRLLGAQRADDKGFFDEKNIAANKKNASREVLIRDPSVLIEGVLFRARYLGSTQLVCEGQPTKATRMMQAEEAVSRIKAPEGETQPSTEVDLFISTEKIMVLNTDLKEIMMDHALRTISYIADIGDLLVLMARRRMLNANDDQDESKIKKTPKMICHVFESEEAQFIAQSIGQAFQVAYMEFLKANGIEDSSFVKEMDYQEVLNSQEIFGNELEMFAKKERQKEVIVPKQKGEILGMVIVESGWGSMLPTVVIANMAHQGPAARCGQLNIGDQIIAINGVSLVGLPLSICQNYIKNTRTQTVVKLTVVPCAPVVEVKIKRPDTKYQLGFSVQNGVICSLLRGGIAERGGVRVGHRIIEINGQSVVAVPHERIVNLLATSVGEIHMKTMPTSMFRLLTGQESPVFI